MPPLGDHYCTLMTPRDSDIETITLSYRTLAKELHPDKHEEGVREEMKIRFQEVQEAYEVMKDPVLKAEYDAHTGRRAEFEQSWPPDILLNGTSERLVCSLCGGIPKSCSKCKDCDSFFCQPCITNWGRSASHCPVDICLRDPCNIVEPGVFWEMMQKVIVRCPNQCGTLNLNLVNLKEHYAMCTTHGLHKRIRQCINRGCCAWFKEGEDQTHHCQFQPTMCQYCSESVPLYTLQAHAAICGEIETQCGECEGKVKRNRLAQHGPECPGKKVKCKFCSENYVIGDMDQHILGAILPARNAESGEPDPKRRNRGAGHIWELAEHSVAPIFTIKWTCNPLKLRSKDFVIDGKAFYLSISPEGGQEYKLVLNMSIMPVNEVDLVIMLAAGDNIYPKPSSHKFPPGATTGVWLATIAPNAHILIEVLRLRETVDLSL